MTPDSKGAFDSELPEFRISYLHQNIAINHFLKYPGSVRDLFRNFVRCAYAFPKFVSNVMVPLQIPQLMDRDAMDLSKAEMDNVALCIFLARVNIIKTIVLIVILVKFACYIYIFLILFRWPFSFFLSLHLFTC